MKDRIGVKFWYPELSNISDKAEIGTGTIIHSGVHIHDDVKIGRRCRIEAGVFIPNGVTIGDEVFVGPGVIFTNDPTLDYMGPDFVPMPTHIHSGAKIGAGSIIKSGIFIGMGAKIGMGSVVTKSVGDFEVWFGNPAKKYCDLK